MSRLPFWFILTGIIGFVLFHASSLFSLFSWSEGYLRAPSGWFYIHLFVLGWATMLAMGAVYQLISVILQSTLYNERLGYIHYVLFTVGTVGLLYGFINGKPPWIAIFASLTLLGILIFAWNIGTALFKASQWNAITLSAASSVLYLVLTGLSGMAMGLNFYFGEWNGLHERLFGTHIWLGTVGWFGLLITGFSYKMLPMFYLAHHYPTRLQNIVWVLWNASVWLGAVSFLFDLGFWPKWFALFLVVAAIGVYTFHLSQIRNHRHKQNPGEGIRWSVYATQAFALIALGALLYTLWSPEKLLHSHSVMFAGWLYLGGWVSFTILSYASKIIPFLWWTHKYGKQVGKPGVPTMAGLLDGKKVDVGLTAIALSLVLLLTGVALNANILTIVGAIAYSIFSIVYMTLIALVFTR